MKSRYAAYFLWLEERARRRGVPFDANAAFRHHMRMEAKEDLLFRRTYRRALLGVLAAICGLPAMLMACREMPPGHSWYSEAALLGLAGFLYAPVFSYGIALVFTPILVRRIDIDGEEGPGHEAQAPDEPPKGGQRNPAPAPVYAGSC